LSILYTVVKYKVVQGSQVEVKKAFNYLYSMDKTRSLGNTGIGLTIAKVLIEKMRHCVEGELTEDLGFSFESFGRLKLLYYSQGF